MFGIAPHVCFYVALMRTANKLIYVKNNKYRKVIAIGMIYFDINYKTQSYIHPAIEPATNRNLFDDMPVQLEEIVVSPRSSEYSIESQTPSSRPPPKPPAV